MDEADVEALEMTESQRNQIEDEEQQTEDDHHLHHRD